MKNTAVRLAARSVRTSKGRWLALFLIVMLSVGFFAGLKVCRGQMWMACQQYLKAQNFYDYRLYTSLGFTDDAIAELRDRMQSKGVGVQRLEGVKSTDATGAYKDGKGAAQSGVFLLMSIPKKVNRPSLVAGRMPRSDDECVVDDRAAGSSIVGRTITFSDGDGGDAVSGLKNRTYTVVGTVNSPLYLNDDRGSSELGSGKRTGFVYLPKADFTSPRYTEVDVTLKRTENQAVYSDAYVNTVKAKKNKIKAALASAAADDYEGLLQNMMKQAQITRDAAVAVAANQGIDAPSTTVLTRAENNGYASFKNDTSIIDGIANVFPVFFILIALLVCVTTMTRMVEEERTQIGTLKALGCSDFSITMKYMLYAGSAALLGWAVGFFGGTWGLPKIFWWAYRTLYDFGPIPYVFSLPMALLTLGASLAAVVLSIWISCRGELLSAPAVLIRPKAAKPGKRIWIEKIRPLWRRLPFLRKVTLRNMFRYKTRMIMMLIGVGSCTALVLTGFGVRDSMIHVGDRQFANIQTYQLAVTTDAGDTAAVSAALSQNSKVRRVLPCVSQVVDVSAGERMGSVTLMSFADGTDVRGFWHLTPADGSAGRVHLPKEQNGAVISKRLAEKLGLKKGDTFKIEESAAENGDPVTAKLKVEDVFENYIGNTIFINEKTCRAVFGASQKTEDFAALANACLVKTKGTPNKALLERINGTDGVTGVTNLADTRADVSSSVSCLNYIIWLLVLFSGALSFIVIFNLTNINLAERSREIATVEVLGFYPKETRAYVLWENLVISILAGFIGLPGGWLFTRFVLSRVLLDNMTFPFIIHGISYLLALICTVIFAAVVNLFMGRAIGRIDMSESLKAVE